VVPRGFGGTGCVTSLVEVLFSAGCAGIVDVVSVEALGLTDSRCWAGDILQNFRATTTYVRINATLISCSVRIGKTNKKKYVPET
jgi:hypothetical protein